MQSERRAKKIIYLKFRRTPRPRSDLRRHAADFVAASIAHAMWARGCFFGLGNSPFTMSHDSMVRHQAATVLG
jgi:hypothetical protein